MKKTMLFLSMIGISLIMTSCLDGGEAAFSSENDFSYITRDDKGLVYARVYYRGQGNFITSSGIQQMNPGDLKFISYSWTEELGTTATAEGYIVYNVNVLGQPEDVSKTELIPADAPSPEEDAEDPIQFVLGDPVKDSGTFFGDYWLFGYSYKQKKGETATLRFYQSSDSDKDKNEFIIDVRLLKAGEPTEDTESTENDYIAVNMSQIRNLYPSTGTTLKSVTIKFRYYRDGQTDEYTTQAYTMNVYEG